MHDAIDNKASLVDAVAPLRWFLLSLIARDSAETVSPNIRANQSLHLSEDVIHLIVISYLRPLPICLTHNLLPTLSCFPLSSLSLRADLHNLSMNPMALPLSYVWSLHISGITDTTVNTSSSTLKDEGNGIHSVCNLLSTCPNLQYLECPLQQHQWPPLLSTISSCSLLHCLKLMHPIPALSDHFVDFSDGSPCHSDSTLPFFSSLTEIHINGTYQLRQISTILCHCQRLEKLYVKQISVDEISTDKFIRFLLLLSSLPKLTTLLLSFLSVPWSDVFKDVLLALMKIVTLEYLTLDVEAVYEEDLDRNDSLQLHTEGDVWTKFFLTLNHLLSLELCEVMVPRGAVWVVITHNFIDVSYHPRLHSLSLHYSDSSDDDMSGLSTFLVQCPNLSNLFLSGFHIHASSPSLAHSICRLPLAALTLQSVKIKKNSNTSSQFWLNFCDALCSSQMVVDPSLRHLSTLNLSYVDEEQGPSIDAHLHGIATLMSSNPSLTSLELRGSSFPLCTSYESFWMSMVHLCDLRVLDLSLCRLGRLVDRVRPLSPSPSTHQWALFLSSLVALPLLEVLYLTHNYFYTPHYIDILSNLSSMTMKLIDITKNYVIADDVLSILHLRQDDKDRKLNVHALSCVYVTRGFCSVANSQHKAM